MYSISINLFIASALSPRKIVRLWLILLRKPYGMTTETSKIKFVNYTADTIRKRMVTIGFSYIGSDPTTAIKHYIAFCRSWIFQNIFIWSTLVENIWISHFFATKQKIKRVFCVRCSMFFLKPWQERNYNALLPYKSQRRMIPSSSIFIHLYIFILCCENKMHPSDDFLGTFELSCARIAPHIRQFTFFLLEYLATKIRRSPIFIYFRTKIYTLYRKYTLRFYIHLSCKVRI